MTNQEKISMLEGRLNRMAFRCSSGIEIKVTNHIKALIRELENDQRTT
jgi:hypothetical protein